MKTIQKFLQAFVVVAALLLMGQPANAQCTVRSVVKNTCHNYTNGSIALQVQGVAPFQFQWSNGNREQNLENLSEGSYSVTVTDAKGSRTTHSVKVNKYQPLQVTSVQNGTRVTAKVTGGKAPYLYHWISLSANRKNIAAGESTQLGKGNYLLVIEDSNGCSESHKFKIN